MNILVFLVDGEILHGSDHVAGNHRYELQLAGIIGQHPGDGDDIPGGKEFRYLIAGKYEGGEITDGMTVYTFPEMEWAKFPCRGPLPGALQSVNTKIFNEWLPGNHEWEIALPANMEWYACGESDAADYQSAIWIPVKKK